MTANRVHRTGPDHFAGVRPSTDADRLRTFGPVQPLDEPKRDWFHTILWPVMIGGTLAVIAYAMGWVS